MSGQKGYDRIEPLLTALQEEWLTSKEAAQVRAHLDTCPVCRAVWEQESRLVHALESLPRETPPPAAWADVHAACGRDSRKRPVAVRYAVALSLAALTVWSVISFRPNVSVPPPLRLVAGESPSVLKAETTDGEDAHLLVSAGSLPEDLNRAVVLLHAEARKGR